MGAEKGVGLEDEDVAYSSDAVLDYQDEAVARILISFALVVKGCQADPVLLYAVCQRPVRSKLEAGR